MWLCSPLQRAERAPAPTAGPMDRQRRSASPRIQRRQACSFGRAALVIALVARCSTNPVRSLSTFIPPAWKGHSSACSCVALSIAAESRRFRVCPAPRSPAAEFRPQQPFLLISRTPGPACQRSSTRFDGYRIPKRTRQIALSPSSYAAWMTAFNRSPFRVTVIKNVATISSPNCRQDEESPQSEATWQTAKPSPKEKTSASSPAVPAKMPPVLGPYVGPKPSSGLAQALVLPSCRPTELPRRTPGNEKVRYDNGKSISKVL